MSLHAESFAWPNVYFDPQIIQDLESNNGIHVYGQPGSQAMPVLKLTVEFLIVKAGCSTTLYLGWKILPVAKLPGTWYHVVA